MVTLSKKGNTKVYTGNKYDEVWLYSTCIVQFNNDKIILNTGGYETSTTKNRMNQASEEFNLGFSVFQKKGIWYVNYKGDTIEFKTNTVILTR